jgi:hypothetical protein
MTRQIAHSAIETLHSVKKISSLHFGGWADDLLLFQTVNILQQQLGLNKADTVCPDNSDTNMYQDCVQHHFQWHIHREMLEFR